MSENRIISLLGIAKKAGKTVIGTDMAVESVRSGKKNSVKLFLLASDASANTVKRIKNTSAYYGIALITTEADKITLAHTVGSAAEISVIGITDAGFVKAMLESVSKEN